MDQLNGLGRGPNLRLASAQGTSTRRGLGSLRGKFWSAPRAIARTLFSEFIFKNLIGAFQCRELFF